MSRSSVDFWQIFSRFFVDSHQILGLFLSDFNSIHNWYSSNHCDILHIFIDMTFNSEKILMLENNKNKIPDLDFENKQLIQTDSTILTLVWMQWWSCNIYSATRGFHGKFWVAYFSWFMIEKIYHEEGARDGLPGCHQ